jgi:predicted HTH transcriptional regulator
LHGEPYGYLVWGVADGTHAVQGTSFRLSEAKVGNQELESWLANQLRPRVDFKVCEWVEDGKDIVLLKVDAARVTPVRFKGVAFIRVGSYKKSLADYPGKERKIWTATTPSSFETGVAMDDMGDSDVFEKINVPAFYDLVGRPKSHEPGNIIVDLENEGVVLTNAPSNYAITNVGALLFARRLADFPSLAHKAIRLVFYRGTDKLDTIHEQPGVKGYAVGFEGLIDYIDARLPRNEEIRKAIRREVALYPIIAIRELVANALVHQDLTQSGSSPMIEVFEDRIEVTNDGVPLINTLRFLDEARSRNEVLASMMRKVGICEERGSGIDKVIAFAEIGQLPAPAFLVQEVHTKAILYAPRPLRGMSKNQKVRACYQHAALKYISNDLMTNTSLRERFQIPDGNHPTASRIISDTVDAGLILLYDPSNKSPRYNKYIPFWAKETI